MADAPLVVRVAANLEEFRKNLLEGVNQIESTSTAMRQMATAYDGSRAISQAGAVMAAIQAVGGVTHLTADEQAKANTVLDAAIQKYAALGQTAPPGMQALADATKGASAATDGWLPILSAMGNSWMVRIAEGVLLRDAIHWIVAEVKDLALALPEMALKGAAVADVEDNFQHLTEQAGRLGDTLLGALKTGTHNTITDFELMKIANKDLTAGLTLTDAQFGTLAKGAFALAQATGTDVKTALDTMNDAMLTGRARALALLTGKIDVTAAEEKFAASLGKSREHLTEEGKLEAMRAAILDGVGAATARLGEQTDGLDERVAQASTSWANFTDNVGKAIAKNASLGTALEGVQQMLIEAFGGNQQTLIAAVNTLVDKGTLAMLSFGDVAVKAGGFIVKEFYATYKVVGDVIQALDLLNLGAAKLQLFKLKSSDLFGIDATTRGQIKEVEQGIADITARTNERGAALRAADAGQAAVTATTAGWVAKLEDLRSKIEAGATAAAGFVGPIQETAAAHDTAAAAAGKHGEALTKLSPAEEAAAKKFAEAVQDVAAAGEGWQGTIDKINGAVVEQMRVLTAAGVPLGTLITYFGLGVTEGKAFTDMLKEDADTLKLTDKIAADSAINWATYFKDVADLSHDTVAKQIAGAQAWLEDQIAKHILAKTDTADFYNWVYAEDALHRQKIEQSALEGDVHSKAHFLKVADDARIAYEFATAHADQYTADWIIQLQKTADAAKRAADTFGVSFDDALGKVDAHIAATLGQFHQLAMASAAATIQGAPESSNQALIDQGYSGFTGFRTVNELAGGIFPGGAELARRVAHGMREQGGPVEAGQTYTVGERGPETLVMGRSSGSIVPNGGGGTTHITIYVNGTAADVARKVMDEITRTMKATRQFPSL